MKPCYARWDYYQLPGNSGDRYKCIKAFNSRHDALCWAEDFDYRHAPVDAILQLIDSEDGEVFFEQA